MKARSPLIISSTRPLEFDEFCRHYSGNDVNTTMTLYFRWIICFYSCNNSVSRMPTNFQQAKHSIAPRIAYKFWYAFVTTISRLLKNYLIDILQVSRMRLPFGCCIASNCTPHLWGQNMAGIHKSCSSTKKYGVRFFISCKSQFFFFFNSNENLKKQVQWLTRFVNTLGHCDSAKFSSDWSSLNHPCI